MTVSNGDHGGEIDWLAKAREQIVQARTRGYSHALLYVTAAQKAEIVQGGFLGPLVAEGMRVHPGTTPDLVKQADGVEACEIVMVAWERPPLPEWAVRAPGSGDAPAGKGKPKAKAKTAKGQAKQPAKKKPTKPSAKKAA